MEKSRRSCLPKCRNCKYDQTTDEGGTPYGKNHSIQHPRFLLGSDSMLMLKQDPQITLWETVLPLELLTLNNELARVDAILDDEVFMAPFLERFDTNIGRPTIPVETYLRLMYLKHRYELGYEVLVDEVSDSIKWRHFCRIPLDKRCLTRRP